MAAKRIVILGTGGNALEILDALLEVNRVNGPTYEIVGFLDDKPELKGRKFLDVETLGPLRLASELNDCQFVLGIGSAQTFRNRRTILESLKLSPNRFETVIHPSASVSRFATLGIGTVILQNATVCTRVQTGPHVLVLPNSILSHDCQVGAYTCIAGGVCLSGCVTVGEESYLGSNCTVMERTIIGRGALVGMGTNVLRDVAPSTISVGNPARLLRTV